jgi:hypothetical protein
VQKKKKKIVAVHLKSKKGRHSSKRAGFTGLEIHFLLALADGA